MAKSTKREIRTPSSKEVRLQLLMNGKHSNMSSVIPPGSITLDERVLNSGTAVKSFFAKDNFAKDKFNITVTFMADRESLEINSQALKGPTDDDTRNNERELKEELAKIVLVANKHNLASVTVLNDKVGGVGKYIADTAIERGVQNGIRVIQDRKVIEGKKPVVLGAARQGSNVREPSVGQSKNSKDNIHQSWIQNSRGVISQDIVYDPSKMVDALSAVMQNPGVELRKIKNGVEIESKGSYLIKLEVGTDKQGKAELKISSHYYGGINEKQALETTLAKFKAGVEVKSPRADEQIAKAGRSSKAG